MFIRYLTPSMKLLDVGCGPGNITLGFAEILSQGHVYGVDIEPSQIELSNQKKPAGCNNCTFSVASIKFLPYGDNVFDALWISHVFLNFNEHSSIFDEIKRVLKPNGIIGIHEPFTDASLIYPTDTALEKFYDIQSRSVFFNGGNPDIGKLIPELLEKSGFEIVEVSAIPFIGNTLEQRKQKAEKHAQLWEQAEFPKQALEQGWIAEDEMDSLPNLIRQQAKNMTFFAGRMQIKVVAKLIEK